MNKESIYIKNLQDVLNKLDLTKIVELIELIKKSNTVYIIGNGGSATTAEHFSIDLLNSGIKAVSLVSNIADISAIANDLGYDKIFSFQLRTLNPNKDDMLISFSASGNSENILNAVSSVKCNTVGITGFDGGKLANLAKLVIKVPSLDTQLIEDVHLVISHMVYKGLKWI